ncbi:Negative regulator of mitotic exit [Scheffersomyces spartinae]|uniref:Negative regulator of mitotic exit n=1 Tax=Scheffersomyces spartinae TaxID=45513 RepID=A0A9P7VAY5_9ASCO|nr:Negative regulator of mitotic exit [Scheffersomyces spartinae]KAG7194711.1 Negative regulator of mitotic exit [Scheffersomyces spartinae]
MARFKFGKKKKSHTDESSDLSSMDQHLIEDHHHQQQQHYQHYLPSIGKHSQQDQLPLQTVQQAGRNVAITPQLQQQSFASPKSFNSPGLERQKPPEAPMNRTASNGGFPPPGTHAGRSLENLPHGSNNNNFSSRQSFDNGVSKAPGYHNEQPNGNSNGSGMGNASGKGGGAPLPPPPPPEQQLQQQLPEPFGIQQAYQAQPPNPNSCWERYKLFNSPFPRYRHAASSIASEKGEVFVMGGLKKGEVFGDTWKIVPQEDPAQHRVLGYVAKNTEVSNKNNPPARVGHSVVLCGNAFIVFGGDTVDTDEKGFPDNNFYLFNINNNKYTIPAHILNKPCGRYGHALGTSSLNNSSPRLYLFGGQLENNVFDDMYYFELNYFKSQDATWKLVNPLNNFKPPPLTNHSLSVYKNKIYVFGGVYNNERVSNDLWCFDVLVEKWTQVPTTGNVPLPVNEHSACICGEKLFIFGGNDFSGVIYDSLYVLDLHTFVWSKLTLEGEKNGPGPRCGHSMTYISKYNRILIMGGEKNDYVSEDPNDFQAYEEADDEPVGTMIYELNLDNLDRFLLSNPMPTKSRNEIHSTLVPGPPPYTTKKMAASAAAASSAVYGNSNESQLSHGRNASEDFRTPNASPIPQHAATHMMTPQQPDISQIHPQVSPPPPQLVESGYLDSRLVDSKTRDIDPYDNQKDNFAQPPPQDFVDVVLNSSEATSVADADVTLRHDSVNEVPNVVEEAHREGNKTKLSPTKNAYRASSDTETETEDEMENDYPSHVNKPAEVEKNSSHTAPPANNSPIISSGPGPVPIEGSRSIRQADYNDPMSTPKMSGVEANAVKKLIAELTSELTQLKHSTKVQMQEATEKIVGLEKERDELKQSAQAHQSELKQRDSIIKDLKETVDPKSLVVNDYDEPSNRNINDVSLKPKVSELTKFKLSNLELNNKLVYLEHENKTLNDKMVKFEPFMKHQIAELSTFQKIIKNQEEKIASLTETVKDQESLHKSVNEWKSKYEDLQLEFNNFKAIHEEREIEVDDDFITDANNNDLGSDNDVTNRSLMSTVSKRTKKDISLQLESLVNLWSVASGTDGTSVDKTVDSVAISKGEVVTKLQTQIDDLLRVSKNNEEKYQSEINTLKQELYTKQDSLKQIEENYREAIQSVNNTSKALKMNQEESNSQRALLDKLTRENNELKLFKKASKRVSSRGGFADVPQEKGILTIDEDDEDADEHERIATAHYTMKIKDLEADLYILKQERDQLKDNVTQLQKQLYLAGNHE